MKFIKGQLYCSFFREVEEHNYVLYAYITNDYMDKFGEILKAAHFYFLNVWIFLYRTLSISDLPLLHIYTLHGHCFQNKPCL